MANHGPHDAYPGWTGNEIATLRSLFPSGSWKEMLEAFPTRTRGAINQFARKSLSLRRTNNRKEKWTAEECAILRRVYPSVSDAELMRHIPRHTLIAIQRQASVLKVLRPRREAREHQRYVHPIIQQLYQARLDRGIRREKLGKKLGYAYGQVLGWELGKTSPEFRAVAEWASALGMEIILRPMLTELPSVVTPLSKSKLMAGRA